MMDISVEQAFLNAFRGNFTSLMRWPQLDEFWSALKPQLDDGWYIYAVGETPPTSAVGRQAAQKFIDEIDALLRREHEEEYCGIVYADDIKRPEFIKIFDPHNLGVTCGYSEKPPLPGWVMSRIPPIDLEPALYPKNRQRWWQKLFD
jgi:hypothetical protein